MSSMYFVLAKGGKPDHRLRLMEIPGKWRGKAFVPTGELQDRPAPVADLWDMLLEEDDDHPMPPVAMPEAYNRIYSRTTRGCLVVLAMATAAGLSGLGLLPAAVGGL